MMDYVSKHIWLILFLVWGMPLGYYRSKFRKLVYQTDSWTINIQPRFWKELKALFGNLYPENRSYKKGRNFYRVYLSIYTVLFVFYFSSGNSAVLAVGEQVPRFELMDQNNRPFVLDSVIGKKKLVIYFYPKDDSPGCTKEACSFRDQFAVFEDADAMIIGISSQSVSSHFDFAKKHRLNYTLLSDPDNKVRKAFGVKGDLFGLIPGRITFVVDKKGVIVYSFDSQMQTQKHVQEALRIIQQLK